MPLIFLPLINVGSRRSNLTQLMQSDNGRSSVTLLISVNYLPQTTAVVLPEWNTSGVGGAVLHYGDNLQREHTCNCSVTGNALRLD